MPIAEDMHLSPEGEEEEIQTLEDMRPSPEEQYLQKEELASLKAAVAQLSKKEQDIIIKMCTSKNKKSTILNLSKKWQVAPKFIQTIYRESLRKLRYTMAQEYSLSKRGELDVQEMATTYKLDCRDKIWLTQRAVMCGMKLVLSQ